MNQEQEDLLRKAHESLRGAQMLLHGGLPSFAASRAYYTMFYVAKAFLWGKGLSHSSHSAVIAAFGKEFAATGELPAEFHRFLIEAQVDRITGDYDTGDDLKAARAEEQIRRARSFLQLAEQRLGSINATHEE